MGKAVGPTGDDKALYKQEFDKSVTIFEESLDGYHKADGVGKKAEFKKAMDESLHVMDQLGPIFSKEIQSQKAALEKDYSDYTAGGSEESFQKLHKDIDSLKHELE